MTDYLVIHLVLDYWTGTGMFSVVISACSMRTLVPCLSDTAQQYSPLRPVAITPTINPACSSPGRHEPGTMSDCGICRAEGLVEPG